MAESSLTARLAALAEKAKSWGDSPAGKTARKWFNAALSILIIGLLVRAIAQVGWDQVVAVLPPSWLFWALFIGSYLLPPLMEWVIYRRWWHFGFESIGVFLKMRVMNEALFSYSGHTYLLVWAANRLGIEYDPNAPPPRILGRGDGPGVDPSTSPVAAVKDMAITSGLAGNLATLVMLLLALSLDGASVLGDALDVRTRKILLWSFGAMIVLNVGIVLFRGKVMSLPVKENMYAFRWHMFRVLGTQALLVGSWAAALPGIDTETWFLLGALRMVIGRMPVPNKDILFAAIAVSLAGDSAIEVAALMAAQGALTLVFHGAAWAVAAAQQAVVKQAPQA